jgi:hypothetical protein
MTDRARSPAGVIPVATAVIGLLGGLGIWSVLIVAGGQGEGVGWGVGLAVVFTAIGVVWLIAGARAQLVVRSDGMLEQRWLRTNRVDTTRLAVVRFEPEAPPSWHPASAQFRMFNLLLEDRAGRSVRLQAGLLGWSRPWEVLRPVVQGLEDDTMVSISPNNWEKLRELAGLPAQQRLQPTPMGGDTTEWVSELRYTTAFIYSELIMAAALLAWPGFIVLVRRIQGAELTAVSTVVEGLLAAVTLLGLVACAAHWRALRRKRLHLDPAGRVTGAVHAGRFRWEERTVQLDAATRVSVDPDVPYPVPPDVDLKPGTPHKLVIAGRPTGPVEVVLADSFEPPGRAWPQLSFLLERAGARMTPSARQAVRYLAGQTERGSPGSPSDGAAGAGPDGAAGAGPSRERV